MANSLVKKLASEDNAVMTIENTDRHVLHLPIKSFKVPSSGPVSREFLTQNNINIFHYEETKNPKLPNLDELELSDAGDKKSMNSNVKAVLADVFRRYSELTKGTSFDRRVTIAYTYEKGVDEKGKETSLRKVRYGAVIFRNDKKEQHCEHYDRSAHTWTAIRRLMNQPVKCELHFESLPQFKKALRKKVHRLGVQAKKSGNNGTFKFVHENNTNVMLTNQLDTQ